MSTPSLFHRVGNKLYKYAFPIYWPAYRVFKIYTDRAERHLLRKSLFPEAIVVDAGANIGVYSRFLSHCVGPGGTVHSFEPSPDNFRRLQAATRRLTNVRINRAAVGDYSGQSSLYVSSDLNVDHRAYLPNGHSRPALSIDMVALDDYFKPHEKVDLIKLDVQGYELHALRGAERLLQENRNIKLLLEFWPYGLKQAGATWRDLVATLERHGLVIQQFSTDDLEPFRASAVQEQEEWYINLFASRR
ncbi:MAG: FkbM family methyltransferase [Chthoniobacterales bacterium]